MPARKEILDLLIFLVTVSSSSIGPLEELRLDIFNETAFFNGRTMAMFELDDNNLTRCELRIV